MMPASTSTFDEPDQAQAYFRLACVAVNALIDKQVVGVDE
jgi:hypothetical protein